jgi:hypothetical protein
LKGVSSDPFPELHFGICHFCITRFVGGWGATLGTISHFGLEVAKVVESAVHAAIKEVRAVVYEVDPL